MFWSRGEQDTDFLTTFYVTSFINVIICHSRPLSPSKADPSAGPAGVAQDPSGDDLAEGLQHPLQLLLIHGQREVGDV